MIEMDLVEYQSTNKGARLFPLYNERNNKAYVIDNCRAISDGVAIVIDPTQEEIERVNKRFKVETFPRKLFAGYLRQAKKMFNELGEPVKVYRGGAFNAYIFYDGVNTDSIQEKYFLYFRKRYPHCKFYRGLNQTLRTVKNGEDIVGIYMIVSFSDPSTVIKELKKEKEMFVGV